MKGHLPALVLLFGKFCLYFLHLLLIIFTFSCYFTSTKTYPPNESWKWVLQVHDSGDMRKIFFRTTTQIDNYFDVPILLYSYDSQKTTFVGSIEPGSTLYLPLSLVYGQSALYVRPSSSFEMSDVPVDWRTIDVSEDDEDAKNSLISSPQTIKMLILTCTEKGSFPKRYFSIKVRGEKIFVLNEDTERLNNDEAYIYHIKLLPFVRLKNLLPYPIQFHYDLHDVVFTNLSPGEEKLLPFAVFGKTCMS